MEQKMIYMHFFAGPADWWMAEYSSHERLFFGYACLGDPEMAEWGYVSFDELRKLRLGPNDSLYVDYDVHWTPKPVKEIREIRTLDLY